MGSTNHGTQEITYEYFENATAEEFNKRNLGIRPRGIYSGGYLTKASDVEVTLSLLSIEIGDDDEQISMQTTTVATLNTSTLDSGSISLTTPYLVLRWGFLTQKDNYVAIHAIASIATAQDNDIVIGKCEFSGSTLSGFSYSERTFFHSQDIFLKVEVSSGMNVQLRAGRIQNGSASIFIPEQTVGLFVAPAAPNSRIDLVYIADTGTSTILQGSVGVSPVAPDYGNKLVVAEVTVVNGVLSIAADKIKDVRSFITKPDISADGTTIKSNSGELKVGNIFGAWVTRVTDTVYLAATDGVVCATGALGGANPVVGYTDSSNPPTTFRVVGNYPNPGTFDGISMPVKKGDYWKVTNANTSVYWLPIGS